jgi:hypothetical protein
VCARSWEFSGYRQPLVFRNLFLLSVAGLLEERREGNLVFYSVKQELSAVAAGFIGLLKKHLKDDKAFTSDLQSLADCYEFQKKTGKCDMNYRKCSEEELWLEN